MDPNWIGAIAGVVAAVPVVLTGAVFIYRRVRRTPPAPPAPPGGNYDVFVSHAPQDAAAAAKLVTELEGVHGLRAFLPERDTPPGDVQLIRRGEGILAAVNGILIFSSAAVANPEIMGDYAALLKNVHGSPGTRRFVPVRVDDTEMPPFAATRQPLDLRGRSRA